MEPLIIPNFAVKYAFAENTLAARFGENVNRMCNIKCDIRLIFSL